MPSTVRLPSQRRMISAAVSLSWAEARAWGGAVWAGVGLGAWVALRGTAVLVPWMQELIMVLVLILLLVLGRIQET